MTIQELSRTTTVVSGAGRGTILAATANDKRRK